MRRLTIPLSLLVITALACNAPGFSPATRLPPATTEPLPAPTGEGDTATPILIEGSASAPSETATETATVTLEPSPTLTPSPTRTATRKPPTNTPAPSATATTAGGGPLAVRNVSFVSAARTTGNSANATLSFEFSGGAAPYRVLNNDGAQTGGPQPTGSFNADGRTWFFIYFTQPTSCGANLVATATLISADGQQAAKSYFVTVVCP